MVSAKSAALQEQSDQGVHCLPFTKFKEQLDEKQNIGQKSIE